MDNTQNPSNTNTSTTPSIPLIVLGCFDGFGYSADPKGNAVLAAHTPTLDYLWANFTRFLLKASEEEVGLNFGEVGNSEVGHMAIGCGRVIPQTLPRINGAMDNGTFFTNEAFLNSIDYVKNHDSSLHLIGMISTPGVHAHLAHFLALIKLAAQHQVSRIYLHLILDGRDSGPKDAHLYLKEIYELQKQVPQARIADIQGRAYGMDRNNNWERIEAAYKLFMGQSENFFPTVDKALEFYYNQGLDDENIPPTRIVPDGAQSITLQNNDSIIFTNYREDRARQLTKALILPSEPQTADPNQTGPTDPNQHFTNTEMLFNEFPRPNHPQLHMVTMSRYEHGLPVDVAFPPPDLNNTLSDVLAAHHIPQIHIAETEKYAHVTYFFNGGREEEAELEQFVMIPSLKPEEFVAHPEMSASGVADAVIQSIQQGYRIIIFNFANCDMIGHTGDYNATVKAVECVDTQIKRIWDTVSANNGYLFITADHGNAEVMLDPATGKTNKKHTINPVPFIIAQNSLYHPATEPLRVMHGEQVSGILSDVAPTILSTINLPIPQEMSGTSLTTPTAEIDPTMAY